MGSAYHPNFTRKGMCRDGINCMGREGSCNRVAANRRGVPVQSCCWATSWRWHMQQNKLAGKAKMVQVIVDNTLGLGQETETRIAEELGNIQIARIHWETVSMVPFGEWNTCGV